MKKLIAFTAAVFASVMLFAGCGSYSNPAGSTGGTIGGNNGGGNQPGSENNFKVSLVYNGEPYVPIHDVTAQWSGYNGITTASFDNDGIAQTTLDGDFRVTISGLDTAYTYNPNIYYATNDNPETVIELYRITPIRSSSSINGTLYHEYEITATGYYRATFNTPEQARNGIYFLYCPKSAGKYSIESIVDVTANEINPIADIYTGSRQFISPNCTVQDTGGASSTYTKNFRYDLQLAKSELGDNVFRYVIRFNSRISNISFPFNIDFQVSYKGEADEYDYATTTVNPEEDFEARKSQLSAMGEDWEQTGKTWTYADDKHYLLGSQYKFNEEDGLWHRWDGENFGEILWAKINMDSIILVTDSGLGFMDGLVSTRNLNGFNYDSFVERYSQYTNSDGCYPVTAEVKVFLQNYSVSQRYFMDGRGWAETHGYKASEADQWLFNCGYYLD